MLIEYYNHFIFLNQTRSRIAMATSIITTKVNALLYSAPGIPPTLIPSKPVKRPRGRKIAA